MLPTNWPENIVFTTNVPWRPYIFSPSFIRNCWFFSEVIMMKKPLSTSNKHTALMFWFFSADGNFEVTLATKATLHYTGDVAWKPPAIYHSSCEVKWTQLFPDLMNDQIILDGCWIFPIWRANLCHEVWKLDIWRISSEKFVQNTFIVKP